MSETKPNAIEIAKEKYKNAIAVTGYSFEELQIITNSVAKDVTPMELSFFLKVSKSHGLDPFKKEMWCYKDSKNNLIIFAGRDGFRSIATKTDKQVQINSMEVRENDKFNFGLQDNEMVIEHSFSPTDRGKVIGAYSIVKKGTGQKIVEYADMTTYNKGYNTWKTHPEEMIKKVAEVHALKKAYSITGLYAEEEFNVDKDRGVVIDMPVNDYEDDLMKINTVAELSEYATKNAGKGKDFDKCIANRYKELTNQDDE